MRQRQERGDPAALRELERMSVAELRSMVEELMDGMPKGWSEETEKLNKLIEAALSEWYRRDGEEAFKQLDATLQEERRTQLLSRLTLIAARTDPALAKAWADRLREQLGKEWIRQIASEAARGAGSRSADEYLAVRELFKDTPPELSAYISYPDDFDFKKIVASLPPSYENSGVVVAWSARNPDAAWEMTHKLMTRDGQKAADYVTSIFHGIALVNEEADAAKWLAEKIGEVPEEHRKRVFDLMWSVESLRPERVTAISNALTTPEDQRTFASVLLGPKDQRDYAPIGLNALASDAEREQVILEYARGVSRGMGREGTPHYVNMSKYIDQTMGAVSLPADAQERVRAALYKRE